MKTHTFLSHLSYLAIGAVSSFFFLSSSLHTPTTYADTIVYEGEASETNILSSDPNGNTTLYFGDSLSHFIEWNADSDAFIFSNNIDFAGNQAINMRLEHIATLNTPPCDTTNSGRLYYNTDTKYSYVCDGSRWKQIDEETVSTVIPFIESVNPNSIEITETTNVTILGNGFSPQSELIIPGFQGTLSNFVLISPSEITVDITPNATTLDGSYDFIINNAGTANTQWPQNGVGIMQMFSTIDIIPGTVETLWERTVDVITAEGSIYPIDNGSWSFDQGGSFGTVPADTDFTLSFTPSYIDGETSGGYAFIGVDATDPDVSQRTPDYAFYFKDTVLDIYENDALKFSYGSYNINDTFKIIRKNNVVFYAINSTIIYTSTINSNSQIVFDTAFARWIGAKNIKMTY